MTPSLSSRRGLSRRDAIKFAAGAGLAAGSLVATDRTAKAADVTLSLWTGYPELVPYYKAIGEEFAKVNAGFKLNILSTSLREAEQKLSAAIPTGTGPDIFDIGSNISIKFIGAGLLDANPADVDTYFKSGAWNKFTVDFFTVNGKTYGLPLLEGRAAMYYNKAMFKEAGIDGPPTTFSALAEAAQKLVKVDASGKMVRSGVSMRLAGQGSGICEKFRFVLEPAGGSIIAPAGNGKWHAGFDNDAGRQALQFYVDVVQKWKVDDPKVPHDADAFVAEKTAILFREAWVIGDILEKNPKLDYGVAAIPRWTESGPYKGIVQPWGIYVSGRSGNKAIAWDFLKFLTNTQNAFKLTEMSGWSSRRDGVDWSPLLSKVPQFEVFVKPPESVVPFVDPVLPVFDEIQSRIADKLPGLYVDTSLNGNPGKVADAIKQLAGIADGILKQASLYG